MRIFRTCLKLSIKNGQDSRTEYIHEYPTTSTVLEEFIRDHCPLMLACVGGNWKISRHSHIWIIYYDLSKYNEDRYMMNRATEESKISNYFPDWLVQWSSILIVCRKVGSVYCLRGSKTNLFGLPFVWDSVRQFNCVSDRYSYQSFSRDEIDLKWSSQE